MKDILMKYLKEKSALKKALVMVVALLMTMTTFDVSTASAAQLNKTKINKTMYVGLSETMSIKGTAIKSVSSSNKKVATVNKKGKVTAIKEGKATIKLVGKNKKAYYINLVVKAAIKIAAKTVDVGATSKISIKNVKIASVKTSNSKIATVTKAGVVKGVKAGKATITVFGTNKKSYACVVTVKNVSISETSKALNVGTTFTLKLNGTAIKSASSSNTAVATVTKAGLVKGIKAGTATITLKGNNNKSYICKVTVKEVINTVKPSAVTIKTTGVTLSTYEPKVGKSITAIPILSYYDYKSKKGDYVGNKLELSFQADNPFDKDINLANGYAYIFCDTREVCSSNIIFPNNIVKGETLKDMLEKYGKPSYYYEVKDGENIYKEHYINKKEYDKISCDKVNIDNMNDVYDAYNKMFSCKQKNVPFIYEYNSPDKTKFAQVIFYLDNNFTDSYSLTKENLNATKIEMIEYMYYDKNIWKK